MQEGIYHGNFKGHAHPLEAENKNLRAQLAESERRRVELVEAVRPIVKWWDGRSARYVNEDAIAILDTIEGNHVTAAQASALAALVGEE